MKSLPWLIFLSAAVGALAGSGKVSPVQKVVQLLSDLHAKIVKDGEAEMKAFEAYADWCQNGAKEKEYEVRTAKSDIEGLEATISKASADIQNSASKIEELAATITGNDGDLKAATEIRGKENAEYVTAENELVDAVDTLDRAISIISKKMRGSALLQVSVDSKDIAQVLKILDTIVDAAALNTHDKHFLVSMVQSENDADDEDMGAPAPDAYKSHSSSILDVLEDMKEKAEGQLAEVQRTEVTARHNYEMLKQSLDDQIAADNAELSSEKQGKSTAEETKAVAEGDLSGTQKDMADAQDVLKNMHTDCNLKSQDHEASVKSRAEELKVITEAKEVLTSTTDGAVAQAYAFLQLDQDQHRQLRSGADLAGFEIVDVLRKLAKSQHSTDLSQLSSRIGAVLRYGAASGEDPFVKVRQLIQEMIERITKDGAAEADHKAYCDEEMGKTAKRRSELEHDTETLGAKIDKAKTQSVNLRGQVAELNKELSNIAQQQAEADKIRHEEHAAYLLAKSDLGQGLEGIRAALRVLKDYYASSPEGPAELLQQPAAPGTHSAADGAASGIIGMLEVVESDFSTSLSQGESQEEASAVDYEKIGMTNRVSSAMKEKDVKYKMKEAASLDKDVAEYGSDFQNTQAELDALLKYTANLRGMCELQPDTYESRKGRRKAEIDGLREALSILDGQAVLIQQNKKPIRKISLDSPLREAYARRKTL